MGLGAPIALWGLLALGLLVLLSFWRLRPARVVVPSVTLWRALPDRVPPIRALRRPRASLSLLLQALAVAWGVVALGAPYVEREAPRGRRVAVVIDLSARMRPRLADARGEYDRLRAALAPRDRVVVYTLPPLARHEGAFDWDVAHRAGDPSVALELAADEAELVFFVGDRAVAARCEQILVGGPLANDGVVDANVDEGRVYVRILGPGGERVAEFEPREEIRVASDGFPLDDVLYLDRRPAAVDVALEGRPDGAIRRALERMPGVRLVRGRAPAIVVRVGEAARPDDPPARVIVDPPGGEPVSGTLALNERHPICASLHADEVRVSGAREVEGGTPILYAGGRPIATLRGRELVIGASVAPDGWPAFPSWPIFWSNVIEFLSERGAQEWLVRRTGEVVRLADGRRVQPLRVGANAFGGEIVRANLLDRASSDLSGERRPFEPGRLPEPPAERRRGDLSAWPAVAALAFVVLAWWHERKAR